MNNLSTIGKMKTRDVVIYSCLVVFITLLAFLPTLKNGFTDWDDDLFVTSNTDIRQISWPSIKKIFSTYYVGAYVPLTILSYALEYKFFKLDPGAYHATNLGFHLVNCFLLFWLVLLLTKNLYVSFVAVLLFAVHPLRVESVAWIPGRKDVLYSFFFLGALISYVLYNDKQQNRYYYGSMFLFMLSVLAKGMAVTLPFILLLLDYVTRRRLGKNMFLEKIPFFIIAIVFGIIAMLGERPSPMTIPSFAFHVRIMAASYGLVFYLVKTVLPTNLSCYYPYPAGIDRSLPLVFYLSFALMVLLMICVTIAGRRERKVPFGFLFFLVTILPYLQLIPAGQIIADRYTYIPSIGLLFLASEGFFWLYKNKFGTKTAVRLVLLVFLASVILTWSILTQNRCKIWKNGITLWSNALGRYPHLVVAHYNLGLTYSKLGENGKAISDFSDALESDSTFAMAYLSRGVVLMRQNEYGRALDDLNRAITFNPAYAEAYNNRGVIYIHKKEYDQALINVNQALILNPKYAEAYNNIGVIHFRVGEYEKAVTDYTNALIINKEYVDAYYNRGLVYNMVGNYRAAIRDFHKALEFYPGSARAHYQQAIAYFKMKEYENARQAVRKAENLGFPVDSNFIKGLVEATRK